MKGNGEGGEGGARCCGCARGWGYGLLFDFGFCFDIHVRSKLFQLVSDLGSEAPLGDFRRCIDDLLRPCQLMYLQRSRLYINPQIISWLWYVVNESLRFYAFLDSDIFSSSAEFSFSPIKDYLVASSSNLLSLFPFPSLSSKTHGLQTPLLFLMPRNHESVCLKRHHLGPWPR